MSIVFNTKTNTVKERINRIGLEAVEAKETCEFENKVNCLFECIVQNYYDFLLATHHISLETLNQRISNEENIPSDITFISYSKRVESLLIAYQAVCNISDIRKIVNEYENQGNEYDFFDFAENRYFYYKKKAAIQDEFYKFKRHGVRESKRDGNLISKCLDFLKDKELLDFNESAMREFASLNGYNVETVKKVWIKHNNLKCKELDGMFFDEEGNPQEVYIADETVNSEFDAIIKIDEFVSFIKFLNVIYYKDFTANMQQYYPHIFTIDFIKSIIEDAKAYTSARSFEDMKRLYWDRVDLAGYRDTYATEENVCVLREHFDWSIDNRDYRTQKELAKFLGVSPQSISKTSIKVVELLRRKVVEAHYAE